MVECGCFFYADILLSKIPLTYHLFLSLNRYLAICRPLDLPRRHSKMTRALWALLLIWIISVTFSLPWLYYNKVSDFFTKNGRHLFFSQFPIMILSKLSHVTMKSVSFIFGNVSSVQKWFLIVLHISDSQMSHTQRTLMSNFLSAL